MTKVGFRALFNGSVGRIVGDRRLVILVAVFFIFGLGGGVLLAERPTFQPSIYNHSVHTAKMDCVRCHRGSRDSVKAGIPSQVICAGCHATAPGKEPSAVERSLWSEVLQGKPVAWNRIYRLPESAFFSHRQHATVAEIECENCHGLMKDQTVPPEFPLTPMRMRECIECHQKEKVTVDCTHCHR